MAANTQRAAAPLRQEILEALRVAIIAGEFPPKTRLIESMLCARYDVSRTVIREVLRQLESESLITMVANRGPEVSTLTLQDAESLYEVRQALEALSASLFAERASSAQCRELVARMDELRLAVASADPQQQLQAKDAFYDALLAGSANDEITRMLNSINARTQILRRLSFQAEGRAQESVEEIDRLTIAAAIERDPTAARQASEIHVRNAAKTGLMEMGRLAGNPLAM